MLLLSTTLVSLIIQSKPTEIRISPVQTNYAQNHTMKEPQRQYLDPNAALACGELRNKLAYV